MGADGKNTKTYKKKIQYVIPFIPKYIGGMYPVRMMDTASSSVPCNNTMNTATMVQNGNAGGGDSDSAVSSMGSERVPSLSSDTEWMETNSDSGHNDGYPSHSHQEYG